MMFIALRQISTVPMFTRCRGRVLNAGSLDRGAYENQKSRLRLLNLLDEARTVRREHVCGKKYCTLSELAQKESRVQYTAKIAENVLIFRLNSPRTAYSRRLSQDLA